MGTKNLGRQSQSESPCGHSLISCPVQCWVWRPVYRIVISHEKWVHHFTLQMKLNLKQWVNKGGRAPKKVKMERSARKIHLTCFWNCELNLLDEYAPKGVTTMKERCFNTLMRHRDAIIMKKREKLSKILLLHNNAPAHMAALIQKLLVDFWWDISPHVAYTPDFTPSDYYCYRRECTMLPRYAWSCDGVPMCITETSQDDNSYILPWYYLCILAFFIFDIFIQVFHKFYEDFESILNKI